MATLRINLKYTKKLEPEHTMIKFSWRELSVEFDSSMLYKFVWDFAANVLQVCFSDGSQIKTEEYFLFVK